MRALNILIRCLHFHAKKSEFHRLEFVEGQIEMKSNRLNFKKKV